MTGVTYDAGALIAAERRNPRIVTFHKWIVDNGIRPVCPPEGLTLSAEEQAELAALFEHLGMRVPDSAKVQ